jgi:hypothetical protein
MAVVRIRGSEGAYAAWAIVVRTSHILSCISREGVIRGL